MSEEQKRGAILNYFIATSDVFNMEQLENGISSTLGVRRDTIADLVKLLASDKAIEMDKIASGNFYWRFSSNEAVKYSQHEAKTRAQMATDTAAIAALEAKLAVLFASQADTAAVSKALEEVAALKVEVEALKAQALANADGDPTLEDAIMKTAVIAKEGADRWTDNLLNAKELLNGSGGRTRAEVDVLMDLPKGFGHLT